MTIKDLPEGKIAVVIATNDPWRGHCVYRLRDKVYFVGMLKDIELIYANDQDVPVRIVGSIEVINQ